MSDAKRSTGTIAANAQTVTLSPNGRSVVGLVLTGTWVINLDVKALIDGTEQDAVIVDKSGAAVSLPLTTNQVAYIDAVGREQIIIRANGYTSGAAAVTLNATDGKLPSATGGSAVSIADGSDATFGAKADAAAGSDAGTFTFMALFKRLLQKFTTQFPAALGGTTAANSLAVTLASDGTFATLSGSVTEAAPANDTASSGLNGRLQRIAQRLTSLLPQNGGRLNVDGAGGTFPVTNANLDAALSTLVPTTDFDSKIGGLTEAAPGTDTASSGLNGRLQRIAQNITTMIAATLKVQGAGAAGAALSGNPVLVGVSDATNAQTARQVTTDAATMAGTGILAAGQTLFNGVGDFRPSRTAAGAGNLAVSLSNLATAAAYAYNGTNADMLRNSQDVSLHGSAVTGTGTVNTDITTYNYNFLVIHANVTLYNAGNVLFKVQMQDANGIFVDIPLATTGAVSTGADIFLTVGPSSWGANASPVFYANQVLPRTIRIVQVVAAASVTFSAAYCLKN